MFGGKLSENNRKQTNAHVYVFVTNERVSHKSGAFAEKANDRLHCPNGVPNCDNVVQVVNNQAEFVTVTMNRRGLWVQLPAALPHTAQMARHRGCTFPNNLSYVNSNAHND